MKFNERLKRLRIEAGLTQKELAIKSGVSYSYLTKLEGGFQDNPTTEILEALGNALGVHLGVIFDFAEILDAPKIPERIQNVIRALPFYNLSISAGGGQWIMDGNDYEYAEFENVPKDADFALRVCGDSMIPEYNDEDVVFVKSQLHVLPWQVGVFYLNGEGYMKKLQGSYLMSNNPAYPPKQIGEFDEFIIFGRVVGKANKT